MIQNQIDNIKVHNLVSFYTVVCLCQVISFQIKLGFFITNLPTWISEQMQKALAFLTRFSGGVSGPHIFSLKVIYTYFSSKCTRTSSKTPLQTTASKNIHSSHKDKIFFFLEKLGNKITTSQIVQISLWELHFRTAKSTVATTQRS